MHAIKETMNPAGWLETTIRDFINKSSENTMRNRENERAWADPLVGFSRADDPVFQEFKETIGDFYLTPLELFSKTFPEVPVQAHQLTVISWILPQTEATIADNRKETMFPPERWARSRIFGEQVNTALRKHVVGALGAAGFKALAPLLSPHWRRETSERFGFASTWSERHAAYASGLGTFGLCDGLITAKGKAMRCGSVVAQIIVPPTQRPYDDHQEYCLFFSKGICAKCIPRCPVGAITKEGHDKAKCLIHLKPTTENYVTPHFHFDGYGCGLCQTGVPCESKIPTEDDL